MQIKLLLLCALFCAGVAFIPETEELVQETGLAITEDEIVKKEVEIISEKDGEIEGIVSSFLFIFSSEIGDKTFILVILYATKLGSIPVFLISSGALVGMHLLSVLVGSVSQLLFTPFLLSVVTAALFFLFGIALVYSGITEEGESFEKEFAEIEEEVFHDQEDQYARLGDEENGEMKEIKETSKGPSKTMQLMNLFVAVVVAELGDRS